jgi:hypothetical protein
LIVNFNDPIYYVESNGLVMNQFVRATNLNFSDDDVLFDHINNSYYIASTSAPSFINRIKGDFSSDPNGIESIVNLDELKNQGIALQKKSAVDYLYFDEGYSGEANQVENVTRVGSYCPWLVIDDGHKNVYGVSQSPSCT